MTTTTILLSIGFFLLVIMSLVSLLLFAKSKLSPSGAITITINNEKKLEVEGGSTLLNVLSNNGVFLPSACGGGGTCIQCTCQVHKGGGGILPTEKPHFSRKQIAENYRLGCQVKVKEDMEITIPEENNILFISPLICIILTIGDNNVLIEFSYLNKPINYKDILVTLFEKGYKPILAHPERYVFLQNDKSGFDELKDMGVQFQLNLFSLIGLYDRASQYHGRRLIEKEMVDYLGTDIHRSHQIKHFKRALSSRYLHYLIKENQLKNLFLKL